MPPTVRSGVDTTLAEANEQDLHWFARIVLPAPYGTLRLTDKGTDHLVDIDGEGLYMWAASHLKVAEIVQGTQGIRQVSWIELGNADGYWTDASNDVGLEGRAIEIWRSQFNPRTGAAATHLKFFSGLTDDVMFGDWAKVTVKPSDTFFGKSVPWSTVGSICIHAGPGYRGPFCQYAGAEIAGEPTCPGTRRACIARSNVINYTAADQLPAAGTDITLFGR
jgi:hypothetical protein